MTFNWINGDNDIRSLKKKRVLLWVVCILVIALEFTGTILNAYEIFKWPIWMTFLTVFAVVILFDGIRTCGEQIKTCSENARKSSRINKMRMH